MFWKLAYPIETVTAGDQFILDTPEFFGQTRIGSGAFQRGGQRLGVGAAGQPTQLGQRLFSRLQCGLGLTELDVGLIGLRAQCVAAADGLALPDEPLMQLRNRDLDRRGEQIRSQGLQPRLGVGGKLAGVAVDAQDTRLQTADLIHAREDGSDGVEMVRNIRRRGRGRPFQIGGQRRPAGLPGGAIGTRALKGTFETLTLLEGVGWTGEASRSASAWRCRVRSARWVSSV